MDKVVSLSSVHSRSHRHQLQEMVLTAFGDVDLIAIAGRINALLVQDCESQDWSCVQLGVLSHAVRSLGAAGPSLIVAIDRIP